MSMGVERWGFLISVMSSPIVYFLTTARTVCPNINPIMVCAHVYDDNYAACYFGVTFGSARSIVQWSVVCSHREANKDRLVWVAQIASLEICVQILAT